jgi:thioredoxin:protein disulfide reductase
MESRLATPHMSDEDFILRLPLLLTLLLVFLSVPGHAGLLDSLKSSSEPEFLPVEQAFPISIDLQGPYLIANWNSVDGYYLYQHRIWLQQGSQKISAQRYSHNGSDTSGEEKQDEAFGRVTVFHGQLEAEFDLGSLQPGVAVLNYQGCAEAGLCYPPQKLEIDIPSTNPSFSEPQQPGHEQTGSPLTKPADLSVSTSTSPRFQPSAPTIFPQKNSTDSWFAGRSWLAVVGLFFLLGLGLTFTPCVLPMVPILTSVVLGQSDRGQINRKRAFLLSSTYVLGMAITYAIAGLTVGLLGAGANLQASMQTPWVLVLFSLLFVVLALSMFGLYELQLPSSIRNRLNQLSQNQQGGQWLGVLIIGILSALVMSPCVSAPLAGALVYIGSTGDAWLGGSALLALGLGMGTPLIILATSGASLLPKAGNWMTQVRGFFGVMLLAVAIWLLARLLPGQISLALWGILCVVYALALGALEAAASSGQRILKGLAWVLLVYGISAITGALQGNHNPLQPLSGGISSSPLQTTSAFMRTDSVSQVQERIRSNQKPVMLDLYADWCISCKVMDEEVFSRPDVQQALAHIDWIQLDVTRQSPEQIRFLQDIAVFGPPTILFYQQGKEVSSARITGETGKTEFLIHVRQQGFLLPAP